MMKSVVNAIQDCGVEVQHIPGGCTGLCQPVDIGINKPYKSRIKQLWESWMIQEGLIDGTTSPPTRELISEWAAIAMKELPVQIIRNAWLHSEYTWFPASCAENDELRAMKMKTLTMKMMTTTKQKAKLKNLMMTKWKAKSKNQTMTMKRKAKSKNLMMMKRKAKSKFLTMMKWKAKSKNLMMMKQKVKSKI